jgi:hypothetical protein
VLILDFDLIGVLIFLWFIYKGFNSSREAKRKYQQRRREETISKKSTRPSTTHKKRREVRPESKYEPAPSWFPFPKNSRHREVARKGTEKVEDIKPKATMKKSFSEEEKQKPSRKEIVTPSIIQLQEKQWKSQGQSLAFDKKAVINGIIWSEILGPPKVKK